MATILIIDDEESIRNLLKEVLERANHRVLVAVDGQEGLTLYQQNKVDLVLMDILMPGTDGLEATLQLTREYLDAKVIAMTGAQGDRNFLDVAKLFGARRVFEKPFDLNKLVEAVKEELAANDNDPTRFFGLIIFVSLQSLPSAFPQKMQMSGNGTIVS